MPPIFFLSISCSGLALCVLMALWRGTWLDRAVAAAFVINEIPSYLLFDRHGWGGIQISASILDVLLMVVLIAAAVKRPGSYLLLLAILQVVIVGVHFARLIPLPLHRAGYASALYILTIAELWGMVVGLAIQARIRR